MLHARDETPLSEQARTLPIAGVTPARFVLEHPESIAGGRERLRGQHAERNAEPLGVPAGRTMRFDLGFHVGLPTTFGHGLWNSRIRRVRVVVTIGLPKYRVRPRTNC